MSEPLELEHESDFRTENVNMTNTQFATDEIKIKQEKDTGIFGADLLMNQAKKKERPRSPSRESNHSHRSDRSRRSHRSYRQIVVMMKHIENEMILMIMKVIMKEIIAHL